MCWGSLEEQVMLDEAALQATCAALRPNHDQYSPSVHRPP